MSTTPAVVQIRQDEILTGEAVALDVQPLGFFLRALGLFIDMVASLVVLVLFVTVTGWAGGAVDLTLVSPILLIAVIVLVMVVIPTAVETLSRGRSLGKLVVGGRIVRTDGGAAGFRHAFIRALLGVLEIWFTLGAVAGLFAAFTARSTRLGDMVAGTYCERTRAPRLPPPGGDVPAALTEWAATADVARLPDRLARRAAQFVRGAAAMDAGARARAATLLATELSTFVAPVPAVAAETFVAGVVALRRDREFAALQRSDARAAALTGAAEADLRRAASRAG